MKQFNLLALILCAMPLYGGSPTQAVEKSMATEAWTFPLPENSTVAEQSVTLHDLQRNSIIQGRRATSSSDSLLFVGSVISTGNTSIRPMGLYSFTEGGTFTTLFKGLRSTGGGALARDLFHSIMYTSPAPGVFSTTWMKINPTTWKRTGGANMSIADVAGSDMAYDPTTDNVYGCYYNSKGTGYVFGYADFELKKRTVIRELEQPWMAVMCDAQGQVYAIDSKGDLLKVDKKTGTTTRIGATGLAPYYMTSGTIDPVTGRCFFTVSTESHRAGLYEINLQNGLATKVLDFPYNEEVTALSVVREAVHPEAPGAAKNLKVNFENGNHTGTASFSTPTTTANGTAASGAIRYRVVVGGIVVAEGETAYGSQVSVPVEAKATGSTRFTVLLINDHGISLPTRISSFVGNGTPRVPSPALTYADGICTVKWSHINSTLEGGYFSASERYYTITRISDGKILADSLQEAEYHDTVGNTDRLSKHQYTVQAHFRGNQSGIGKTKAVISGSVIEPAFSDNFDNKDLNAFYTIINSNGDAKTWIQRSSTTGGFSCSGVAETAMDDWLITPPIRLKAGYIYRLQLIASAGYASKSSERMEVKWGKSNTVDGMTEQLIAPVILDKSTDSYYTAWLRPQADGIYYAGIHGISDAGSYRLDIDNLLIDEAVSVKAPALSEGFTTAPAEDGTPSAQFSFNAPTKAIDGSTLKEITNVTVISNGRQIAAFENVQPGSRLTFSDTAEKAGSVSYTITASNTFGKGQPLEVTSFLGINTPADVSDLTFTENSAKPGQVTISWTAPEVDKDGNPLNKNLISYTVTQLKTSGEVVVAEGLKQCSYTYQAVSPEADQEFLAYGVYAVTKGGKSAGKGTQTLSVGTPYKNPYRESFANGHISHNLGINRLVGSKAQWVVANEATFTDMEPADGDAGFMAFKGENMLDSARLYTGKIALDPISTSALTFFTFNITEQGQDINTLTVEVNSGNGWKKIQTATVDALCNSLPGWQRVEIDLSAYKGKTVQIAFTACVHLYAFVMIDAVRIGSITDRNLALQNIIVPIESQPGMPVNITASVGNEGRQTANGYSVRLMRGDKVVSELPGTELKPGLKNSVHFTDTLSVLDDEEVTYKAEVAWADDQISNDNISDVAKTKLSLPVWPVPTNLQGEQTGSKIKLSWTAPDLVGGSAAVTESFESYPAYSNSNLGNWTLVDADQGNIGSMQNIAIPGIDQGSMQSWFVMTSQLRPENTTFAAHSGNQYLSNMYVAKNGQAIACDDWLISPLLSGKAQTISFWAKSYNSKYLESFRVMVSSSDKEIASFTQLDAKTDISGTWTEYSFTLPAGTKYFAIRCVSFDRMMMLIDDVTYQPASGESLVLAGYNVYRDGVKINSAPVNTTEYLDRTAVKGNHRYRVTAVYNAGESRPTNEVSVVHTGVDALDAPQIAISSTDNGILISNASGKHAEIADIAGKVIFAGNLKADYTFITTGRGIYIVRIEGKAIKLIVE